MDEIFNPSLIISLGPSSKKALDFSKKLINHMPEHFLNLINCYEIQSLETMPKELQEIIDTKLLSSNNVNRLVDLGYKVRSENINTVRINLYLFWDIYGCELDACEIVKSIFELNFGNIDRDQHSGASLFIIPMMEREWIFDENKSLEASEQLSQVVSFISQEDSMLTMDSKVYILHSVSSDGTRIPKDELEKACGMLAYLNIQPSNNPPLSHFIRRPLMNEKAYKVGTVGISSLVVFNDRLLGDFTKYLSIDILKYATAYEGSKDYRESELFKLIAYKNQKDGLKQGVNIALNDDFGLEGIQIIDLDKYPLKFKAWQDYLENQYLNKMKAIIDKNLEENTKGLINKIEEELKLIAEDISLKEALDYIIALEKIINKQRIESKPSVNIDTSMLSDEINSRVTRYSGFKAYFYYRLTYKKLQSFIENCKQLVVKKVEGLIEGYAEKCNRESYKNILSHLTERKQLLYKCISNMNKLSAAIVPIRKHEEKMEGLIADLLNYEDRHNFYLERCPRIPEVYRVFLAELESFEELSKESLSTKLEDYTIKVSRQYINSSFLEYIAFKHKKSLNQELKNWVDRGIVKSKHLLQYISNEFDEEHLFLMASSEVYKAVKNICSENISDFEALVIEAEDYMSSISILRLCLGLNIDSIVSLKNIKEIRIESA